MRWTRARTVVAACVLATFCPGPAPAREPANIMIVFDGSLSMWGKFPGERSAKFTIVRDALNEAMAPLPEDAQVGLIAFGHRGTGCRDVQLLVELQSMDVGLIAAPLKNFNPRGRGPIALALREAAQAMADAPDPASLILIHDDPDNCQKDLCSTVSELARQYPKLAVHVVSLGLKPEDRQRMSCVAQATGGKTFDAQNGQAAAEAIAAAVRLAAAIGSPAVAARAPKGKASDPAPRAPAVETVVPPTGPPGLRLFATLGAEANAVSVPARWRIRPASAGETPIVAEAAGTVVTVALPAGAYEVEARAGLIVKRQTVEAAPKGPTPARVVLNAGALRLRAFLQKDTVPASRAIFAVAAAGQAAKPLWVGREPDMPFALLPGTYEVAAHEGQARDRQTIEVTAGTLRPVDLRLDAGRLKLQATQADGTAPLDTVFFQIMEDDPQAAYGLREVIRSAASQPDFTLPAGTYHAIARVGTAEARERVVLPAGETVNRTLVLRFGRVRLAANLKGSAEALSGNVFYRVERLDPPVQDVVRTGLAAPILDLAAGRYRIHARLGALNAWVSREVTVKAASEQTVAVEFAAGEVRFKLSEAVRGLSPADVFWEITDEAGKIVWHTTQQDPHAHLAAGRYRVRIGRFEKVFDIKPAESKTVAVGPE